LAPYVKILILFVHFQYFNTQEKDLIDDVLYELEGRYRRKAKKEDDIALIKMVRLL
jgi:hypothetical protein